MIRLIYKALIFSAILFGLAYLLQLAVDSGFKKSDYAPECIEWYNITKGKINSDILILGNSKAKAQISPAALESGLKLSTYNMGINNANFPDVNYRFKQYIKYNKLPKIIILSVDIATLYSASQTNYAQFIPYLNNAFLNEFKGHTIFSKKDVYIPLYKYSHQHDLATTGLQYLFKQPAKEPDFYNGFQSYNRKYNYKPYNVFLSQNPHGVKFIIKSPVYRDFIAFVNFCNRKKIKLILLQTPPYTEYQKQFVDSNAITNFYSMIAKKYHVVYLDYSKDPICKDINMYMDFLYLNTNGVNIFNKELIHDLKRTN